jgi:signal transduction histidine kinase
MSHLHSIRTRLTVLLTLVATIVYGTFAFWEVNEKSAQIKDELLAQIDALLNVQVDALSVPLWNFDQDEVRRQLGVLVTHGDIIAASVVSTDGDAYAIALDDNSRRSAAERSDGLSGKDADRWGSDLSTAHTIEREILNDGVEPIGRLVIAVSDERTAKIRNGYLWTHTKEFLILTLVITVTMAVAVTGLVRPVLEITKSMDDVAGGNIHVDIPATERRDEIGKMARALQVFKANAEQLQVALERERELNGLQRQFVSMVSHEFRTPLAVIDGNAQRVLRRPDASPERLTASMRKVRTSVINLTELMESVLNAARLEEGRIAFEPSDCPLTEMLKELCGSYAELNADRVFHVEFDQLPETIIADRKLLRQVFSNLLSNAIKYSPDGKNIWVTGQLDEEDELFISIRDEGVGIPSAELEKLFSRFFRASTSTGIAGSGIGLHLVEHFIDLHEGRIEVESAIGEGTTFTVRLPFVRPAMPAAADAA